MDRITLDRDVFKVLASDTRLDILKALDERQKTVTELARELNLNKATVFEHLEKLTDVELVNKLEDERKWVYYQLSWKGRRLLHPEKITIALLLSSAVASLVTAASAFWLYFAGQASSEPGDGGGDFGAMNQPVAEDSRELASPALQQLAQDPALLGVAIALLLLVVTFTGLALVVWRRARRRASAAPTA